MKKPTIVATGTKTQFQEAECLELSNLDWFRHQLVIWASQNLRDFPWRGTSDPYAIFIAEFLLQKTGASTATPVYEAFISRYPTLAALAATPTEQVAVALQPLGLHFRAERLCQSMQIILEQHDGKIPHTESELLQLPGVGLYTARSICAHAFSQPKAVLDTNVVRILERFFGLQGNRVKSRCKLLWKAAERVAPDRDVGKWNLTLLDFGAIVCTAKKPNCDNCPLHDRCHYLNLTRQQKLTSP
ncbi:A/G-specific adenine glycosylase [Coleofasciculus sp. FACHB-1120]|uniref:A/G-specific adenine glycosylase n=1 Tax=Coleofasciculus sp. FACHB-1120 TaxID=2692783 RepID=UPI001689D18A|nr:A/G-specific adenine glycosylase [Coleofasciculus sp. FACHB-1120]MBD2740545.1 A/G-specific adenine glycosylase [Coleofasciculus sp. FACHB-1120]